MIRHESEASPPDKAHKFVNLYNRMEKNNNNPEEQANNPLHGVKLTDVLNHLLAIYSWKEMGEIVRINCFMSNPTIKSSLKFLRQTPWAREKVERLYLKSLNIKVPYKKKEGYPKKEAYSKKETYPKKETYSKKETYPKKKLNITRRNTK